MTKFTQDLEDILEMRLLIVVYHIIHPVKLKPLLSIHCGSQVPCNVKSTAIALHDGNIPSVHLNNLSTDVVYLEQVCILKRLHHLRTCLPPVHRLSVIVIKLDSQPFVSHLQRLHRHVPANLPI